MSWLRVDDGFAEHPKLEALTDRQFRLWAKLLGRCARYRTDGHVPAGILVGIRVKPGDLDRFTALGLLDSSNGSEPTVHDWSDYNPKDPTKADRQARWRAKQASTDDTRVDAPVDGDVDAGDGLQSVSRVRAGARGPVPSRPSSIQTGAVSAASPSTTAPDARAKKSKAVCRECGVGAGLHTVDCPTLETDNPLL